MPRSGPRASSPRPGRSTSPTAPAPDYWRMGARPVRRRLSRRRPGAQRLQLSLHAGRRDDGKRRPGDRLHGVSGRHRADRAAGAGHRRAATRRLRRHAELPASCCSRRPTSWASPCLRLTKASVGGEAFPAPLARELRGARHRRHAKLRHGRPRPDRLRDRGPRRPGRRRRRASSRSCGRAPATRCAEGEVGEVVVTTLNPDYPLIRFGTGDLSAVHARALPHRPHQPAHPRLARPRRPVGQGARHVRASAAGGRDRAPASGDPPRPARRQRRDGRRPDDAATSRSTARRPRAWPSASPRRSAT